MVFSEQQIESLTEHLRLSLGDNLSWSFDARHNTMLSEFAQNKADAVLTTLSQTLVDQWSKKQCKYLPEQLKRELGNLAKLTNNQRILALSGDEGSPTVVALWWPWDHGGTYSLRLKIFPGEYQYTPEHHHSGVLNKIKRLFAMS